MSHSPDETKMIVTMLDHVEAGADDPDFIKNEHQAAVAAAVVPVGGLNITPEEYKIHRRVNLKYDFCVLFLLTFMYLFNGLDRSNLGSAQTVNMAGDVGIPADSINQATTLFYATFVTIMPLSVWIGKRIGVANWIPCMMVGWGCFTIAHGFIKNETQLIVYRLMIGIFEGGFYPNVAYYYCSCYVRYDLAFRLGIFYGSYSVAGAFSGVIAYGLLQLHGTLEPWQWLFIIEGVCTIFLALIAFVWLPRDPEKAWFLNQEEKAWAHERMQRDSGGEDYQDRIISKANWKSLAVDWKIYAIWPMNLFIGLTQSAFGVFLPLIVQALGYSSYKANLYSVPIYVCGAVGLWVICFSSDRFKDRLWHLIFASFFVILGGILVTQIQSAGGRYAAMCVMNIGNFATSPLAVAWLANNTPTPGHRALILAVNSMGNLGGVIAAELFLPKYAPAYKRPFFIAFGLSCFSFVGFIGLRYYCVYVNRWRAKKIASMTPEEIEEENTNDVRLGDKKWTFQYTL